MSHSIASQTDTAAVTNKQMKEEGEVDLLIKNL